MTVLDEEEKVNDRLYEFRVKNNFRTKIIFHIYFQKNTWEVSELFCEKPIHFPLTYKLDINE